MSDADAALLAKLLGMSTHIHPKLQGDPASPGMAVLGVDSGLFLRHGDSHDQWMLEARTWGDPPAQLIREWEAIAVVAARRLDPAAHAHPILATGEADL